MNATLTTLYRHAGMTRVNQTLDELNHTQAHACMKHTLIDDMI